MNIRDVINTVVKQEIMRSSDGFSNRRIISFDGSANEITVGLTTPVSKVLIADECDDIVAVVMNKDTSLRKVTVVGNCGDKIVIDEKFITYRECIDGGAFRSTTSQDTFTFSSHKGTMTISDDSDSNTYQFIKLGLDWIPIGSVPKTVSIFANLRA